MPRDSTPSTEEKELLPSLTPESTNEAHKRFKEQQVEVTLLSFGPIGKKKTPSRRTIKVSRYPRTVGYEREEFEEKDEIFSITDTDFMAMSSNEVMYGSPHHIIDEMPQMARMIVEDQSFISFSNRLFRMVDPETQAASYLANKKLKFNNGRTELIPVKNRNVSEGYEFENGAGIDEEESDEWNKGGTSPALLAFVRDIMPDHQCDEAQLVILETADVKTIVVPDAQDFMIKALGGKTLINAIEENKKVQYELSTDKRVLIEGLCLLDISCQSEEDSVLVIGKTTKDEENNDMLMHALARGYQDIHIMYEPQSLCDCSLFDDTLDVKISDDEHSLLDSEVESHFVPEGTVPDLTALADYIPKSKIEQINLFHKETNGKITIDEWRIRKKQKRFMNLLSDTLNSPYVGMGFRPPAPRWQRIIQESESIGSIRAQERNEYFLSLHARAKQICSYAALVGSDKWTCPKCNTVNNHRGFDCTNKDCPDPKFANKTGFYAQIKEKNIHDRDIGKEWSEQPQKSYDEEIGEWITIPSAFHQKREAAIKTWQEKGFNEKQIERKLWHWFDRKTSKQEAKYDYTITCSCGGKFRTRISIPEFKKIICQNCKGNKFTEVKSSIAKNSKGNRIKTKTIEESVWRQRRSEAFLELYLTKAQWNTIYKQLAIQKRRIFLAENLTQDRQDAYNELRSLFRDCDSIQDLNDFKERAYRQRIESDGTISIPSLIDRISFGDERRIICAIAKKHKEISKKLKENKCCK